MTMHSSPDSGRWKSHRDGEKVYLLSDDFTHDVKIEISGDFGDPRAKETYAKALAAWMNERLMDDADDGIKIGCKCSTCKQKE